MPVAQKFQIGKVSSVENPENIFFIDNCNIPSAGINIRFDSTVYDVKARSYGSFTIIELPMELSLQINDIIEIGYFNNTITTDPVLLPKCEQNVIKEYEAGESYYFNNAIDVFPYGSWDVTQQIADPYLFLKPNVFGENLFAKLWDFVPDNVNGFIIDVFNDGNLIHRNVKMFTNEWVGIHYKAFLDGTLETMYYGNVRLENKDVLIENTAYPVTKLYWWSNVDFLNYRKFVINKPVMEYFQNNTDLSVKVVESDIENTIGQAGMVTWRKYANTYNYLDAQQGKFEEDHVYSKIKDNIDWNGFKSIDEYEIVESGVYTSESFGQSEVGWYNYPNETLYLLYTSKMQFSDDSTVTDTTVLYSDISMILKLECGSDSTSYTVQNAFTVPYDFSNSINREIMKMDDDIFYYCSSNGNMIIDFNTNDIIMQRYKDATGFEYIDGIQQAEVLSGLNEGYKYAPFKHKGNVLLYQVTNYIDSYGTDFFGKAPVVYDYEAIPKIYLDSFGYKPPIITKHNALSDIMFNNDQTEIYLNLNKDVYFNNYSNPQLLSILDDNVVTYWNGTTTLLHDDDYMVRIGRKFYTDIHNPFNDGVMGILNVSCTFDSTTTSYTSKLNYDVFGDSIYIANTINTHDIDNLINMMKENETMMILMSRDEDAVAGTEFEKYPKNIVVKAAYMLVNGTSMLVVSYPERFVNLNKRTINRFYRYEWINRFKSDFLDNVLYAIEI